MKSYLLFLALVGMVGCSSGKQAKLPDLRHPVEGSPCSNQAWASTAGESYNCVNGKWINNNPGFIMAADGGESVIHVDPPKDGIHQKCPDKGCDEVYRDATYLHPKADNAGCPVGTIPGIERDGNGVAYSCYAIHKKKPAMKKPQAMTDDSGRWSDWPPDQTPPTPDKAAVSAEILKTSDSGLISTTFTLSALPAWSATIGPDNNIEITDPKHELKCYGGPVGNADFSDASTGFTITCVTKPVEKAKVGGHR